MTVAAKYCGYGVEFSAGVVEDYAKCSAPARGSWSSNFSNRKVPTGKFDSEWSNFWLWGISGLTYMTCLWARDKREKIGGRRPEMTAICAKD